MQLTTTSCLFLTPDDIEEAFLQASGVGISSMGSWNLKNNEVNVSPCPDRTCFNGGQTFIGYVDAPTDSFDVWDEENQCGRIQTKKEVMAEICKWKKGKDSEERVTYQWVIAFIVTYSDIFPKADCYIFSTQLI